MGRVQAVLRELDPQVVVTLEPPQAELQASAAAVAEALAGTPYRVGQAEVPALVTYRPLLLILGYLLAGSLLVQVPQGGIRSMETMRYFMAGFFLVFSFFKLLNLPAFVDAYAGYDLLAARWRGWGWLYPFVELALGLAYLSAWQLRWINLLTLVVMGFSTLGVLRAVLGKRKIRCACLGTVFQLPMSTVTLIEDLGMVLMAAAMLV